MRTISRSIVAAILLSNDGAVFMGKKNPHGGGVYPHAWHLPGGGIEDGESVEQALFREVSEETGINISDCDREIVNDSMTWTTQKTLQDTHEVVDCLMKFTVFMVHIPHDSSVIRIIFNDDLIIGRWFARSELTSVQLTPPSIELFTGLGWLSAEGTPL